MQFDAICSSSSHENSVLLFLQLPCQLHVITSANQTSVWSRSDCSIPMDCGRYPGAWTWNLTRLKLIFFSFADFWQALAILGVGLYLGRLGRSHLSTNKSSKSQAVKSDAFSLDAAATHLSHRICHQCCNQVRSYDDPSSYACSACGSEFALHIVHCI